MLALFNPFIGLLIYIAFSILHPPSLWHWSVPQGHYSRIIAVAMIIGWVFKGLGQWNFGRGRVPLLLFIGFWLWMIPSTLLSAYPMEGWGYVEITVKILLPFLMGLTIIHSWAQVRQLLWVMIICVGYIAFEMNVSYFSGYNRAQFDGFASLDNNGLAVFMVMGFCMTFFVLAGNFLWWEKLVAGFFNVLLLHTVLFSYSRGGMLALVVVSCFSFFIIPKRGYHYLIFAIILVIGIRLAGPEVIDRFAMTFASKENRDRSAESRLELWSDCVDTMIKNPIFGIGPANWVYAVVDYGWEEGKAAHTTWLQVGAELGIPGLLFISCFYGFCLKRLWPLARGELEGSDSFPKSVAQMVIGSLLGFIISAQFVSLINVELPYYLVLLGTVVLKITSENKSENLKNYA